ncbi:PLP-dependent transferase, partial [Amniculicola lignicola CBS 123094]
KRANFISRWGSYHGVCPTTLALGGHWTRRKWFEACFATCFQHVEPCYAYRNCEAEEATGEYVKRLVKGFEDKIDELGASTACAIVVEPIVGAALGCAPYEPGYLVTLWELCDKYGILRIFDEIMCGIVLTGTMYAWQHEHVVLNIQAIGKGLATGIQSISAVLVGPKVVTAFEKDNEKLSHGHTFQAHLLGCAAGLEVLRIIREKDLVKASGRMGDISKKELNQRVGRHRSVGDIRERGLFEGEIFLTCDQVEFVQDKKKKKTFPSGGRDPYTITSRLMDNGGMSKHHRIYVYPCTGRADGKDGDGIIIAPALAVTEEDIILLLRELRL